MLALPADAGGLGQRLFHDWRRVDKDLDGAAVALAHPAAEHLELLLDDIVVVAVARIDGDVAFPRRHAGMLRGFQGAVIEAEDHDPARLGPECRGIGPAVGLVAKPTHIAVISSGKESG